MKYFWRLVLVLYYCFPCFPLFVISILIDRDLIQELSYLNSVGYSLTRKAELTF